MTDLQPDLRETIKHGAHWRILIRPQTHRERLTHPKRCLEIAQRCQVRLRGWSFPRISQEPGRITEGDTWIQGWSSFQSNVEFWRLYQSGQFVYLKSVREPLDDEWSKRLAQNLRFELMGYPDLEGIRGYLSLHNFIYTIAEPIEFAARLCEAQLLDEDFALTIELHNAQNFAFSSDKGDIMWHEVLRFTKEHLSNTWEFKPDALVSDSEGAALAAIDWFLARAGWRDLPSDTVVRILRDFLRE